MAAKDDFFLNFDSNASTWVNKLKTELQPARDEIKSLQALLTSLETQAARSGSKITGILAADVGGKKTQGGATIPGAERLMTNMVAASGELDHIISNLSVMVRGFADLPAKVTNSMRGVSSAIQAELRRIEGRGPLVTPGQAGFQREGTSGALRTGTAEHRIVADFREALKTYHQQPSLLDRPSIASVSSSAIDKAGVDRIVNAIKAQTKVISSGISVQGAPVEAVAGKKKRSKAKVQDATLEVEVAAEDSATKLQRVEKKLAKVIRLMGDDASSALQEVVAELEAERASLRAAERKLERTRTGKTKGQQSDEAAAAFAKEVKNRPTISADEIARRRELTALINSPGAGDFTGRLGAARTTAGGNYSRADLDKMVAAYREVGIIVKANSKTTKEELAARLQAANVEYRQTYPEGAEALRTTGFNVVKQTKIGDETAAMLGGLDDIRSSAVELSRAFDVLAADARGGGKRPQDAARATAESVRPEPGQPRGGNIVVPPNMIKGGQQRGSGLTQAFPLLANEQLYTQAEFNSAMVATRANADRAMGNVLKQAKRPDFDPYDAKHGAAIEAGTTPEEIRLAQAARNRLRDTRLATQALDEMGQEFFGLKRALDENSTRAGNLRNSIMSATKAGQDTKSLESDYAGVNAEIENIHKRLMQIPRAYKDVFETPGYKKGLLAREGNITDPQAVGAQSFYRTLGSDRTMAQRDQLREEVKAAEKAIASGQRVVKKLNADAAKGLEIDVDEFTAAMDKIERAEAALPRFRHELEIVERLFQESADGAQKLASQVGGMGSRQAFEARREAAQSRETFSDYRTIREATGASVAGGRTAMGSRATSYPLPNTVFANGEYRPRGEEQWSKRTRQKIDAATHQHTKAELDYVNALRGASGSLVLLSTVNEVNEAQENLAKASNLLANRLAKVNHGIAPSFQQLSGFNPIEGSKAERDEARRRLIREQAEAERTRKFTSTPQQLVERGEQSEKAAKAALAQSEVRLAEINQQLTREAAKEKKARERLVAGLDDGARAAYDAAHDRQAAAQSSEARAFREFNSLASQTPYLRKEMESQFGSRRHASTGAFLDPYKRTSQGYDASLGYGRSEGSEELANRLTTLNRAEGELLRAERDLREAIGAEESATDRLTAEKRQLKTNMVRFELAVQNAAERVDQYIAKLPKKQRTAAEAARAAGGTVGGEAVSAGGSADVQALRAQIDQGVEARRQRTALNQRKKTAEGAELSAIQDEINQLRQVGIPTKKALKEMRQRLWAAEREEAAAGGGAGGGGGKRTSTGGFSEGDDSVLRQILAKLNEIHGTLKGGVKITGKADVDSSGASTISRKGVPIRPISQSFPKAEVDVVKSGQDAAAVQKAIAAQRRREAGLSDAQIERAHSQALQINNNLEKDRAKAVARSVLAEERLRAALALTSHASQEQIAVLANMIRAGASEDDINRQRLRTYQALDKEMASRGVRQSGRTAAIGEIFQNVQPTMDPKANKAMVGELGRTAQSINGFRAVDQALAAGVPPGGAFGPQSQFTHAMFGNHGFWSRVMNSTGTFIVRNFTAGFVFGMTAALQQVVDQAIQAEATFVRVSAALEATGKDTGNIRSDLQGIASEYGVQLNDVYQQAAGLAGLFNNAEDLAAGTRIAAQMQIISGGAVNATEAIGILSSTLSAFEAMPGENLTDKLLPGGIEGVTHVADVLTSIQNNLGTNIEITAEGVSRMSGLARQMELSFEQTAVFTAQIAKQTNQTGAAAGEQFSRILAGLQTGRGRGAAVQAFGPGIEEELGAGNFGAAIERMISGWEGLSDAQRRNLTVAIAGSRQAASFNALMNNGTRTINALRKAEDANGDAAERMSELVKTLNNQLARLGTNVQVFASNLIQTGILDFFGVLLYVTNNVLEAVNGLLNLFNGFAESNGFLKFLRDAIGLLVGAGVAMVAVRAGVTGIKGAMAAAAATNAGSAFLGATTEAAALRRGRDLSGEVLDPRQRSGSLLGGRARVIQINADRVDTSFLAKQRIAAPSGGLVGRSSGLLAGGFAEFSNRMVAAFEDRMDRAETMRSRYGDQVRYSSIDGPDVDTRRAAFRESLLAGGMSETEVARRTRAPDKNLLRTAGNLERLAKAGDFASRRTANVASALDNLSGAGLGADIALGLIVAGVAAFVSGINKQANDAKIAEQALSDFRLTPEERRAEAEKQDRYIGQASTEIDRQREDLMKGGFTGWWNRTMADVTAQFTNGPTGVFNPAYALEKQYGLADVPLKTDGSYDFEKALADPNNLTGMDKANKFIEDTRKRMAELAKDPKATVEQLRDMEESAMRDLDAMSDGVDRDASLSEGEKLAAAASLERARAATSDMVLQYSSMIDDLSGTMSLTASQLADIQEIANLSIQTGGSNIIGGLDVGPIFQDLIGDTGVEGSGLGTALAKLSSGGTDVIDRAQINLKILRESVTRLYGLWRSKLEVDPLGDDTIAVRSQLLSAISQLQQASDQVIQSMYDNAGLLGGQARIRGDLPTAIGYYIDALDQADRQYDIQTRAIEKSFEAQDALARTVSVNQSRLQGMLADQATGLAGLLGLQGTVTGSAQALLGPLALQGGELPPLPKGIEWDPSNFALTSMYAPPVPDQRERKKGEQERRAKYDQGAATQFQTLTELLIMQATKDITLQIARTADAGVRAGLEAQKANIEEAIYGGLRSGNVANLPGLDALTKGQRSKLGDLAAEYGDLGVSAEQLLGSQVNAAQAQIAAADAQKQAADEARQQAAALAQARLGVKAAWADARGDTVAAAQVQVQVARATMAAAQADLAAASTASETATARIAILNAQAQIIAANAAVQSAQTDLIQSQYDVSIALAEAAGNTVLAAQRQLAAARAALKAAMKRSGGKATAEVNAARAEAIRADAAVRDARLQDDLDTINFNLEMGKITQSSAIAALREILRTHELTKQQRRDLLLQIKGMKDEMADSQWNFGDIKLPTPYQMRRYIEQRKEDFRGGLESAARSASAGAGGALRESGSGGASVDNSVQNITFQVNGADVAQVKRIIREVVGTGTKTRTTGARRR